MEKYIEEKDVLKNVKEFIYEDILSNMSKGQYEIVKINYGLIFTFIMMMLVL